MRIFLILITVASLTSCSTTSSPKTEESSACEDTATSFRCVKVIEVYDGDTIFIDLPDQHPLFGRRMGVRILGIDTAERRTKDSCEKKKAMEAKAALESLINKATSIDLVNVKKDKYFRILAEVMIDGRSLADELITLKLAYPYHGEKKVKRNWCK